MDLRVYPQSRIAALPRIAQAPAVVVRNFRDIVLNRLVMRGLYGFTYFADGMATTHYSPFMEDEQFSRAYARMSEWWHTDRTLDVRWRMWVLTQAWKTSAALPGAVVEFGAYRGGCAYMMLSTTPPREGQPIFLFDTFEGIPASNLTSAEQAAGFAGRLSDTTMEHVEQVLRPWAANLRFVKGDIFETLTTVETGAVAFCHLDLNASAPTVRALEYLYPRLLPGAIVVMDDYGQHDYREQRLAIDAFLADKSESVMTVPTSQGLLVKSAT